MTDTKLPWKVPIAMDSNAGVFQITRKRLTSDYDDLYPGGLDLPAVVEERPATISQEAGSRVPPQFPLTRTPPVGMSPYNSSLLHGGFPGLGGDALSDLQSTWLFGAGAVLSPTWGANSLLCNTLGNPAMFPPTPPASLTAAAAAPAATSKKESANQIPEIKKKKAPDVKKGSKESNLSPVGVGAQVKADKVLQPPTGELTTVMLRHIPNRYTSTQLVELLDAKGFQAKYDFVYLPIDFQNKVNLGYCFVNLLSHQWALKFKEEFEGFKAWLFDSIKASEVSWAHPHQGLEEHIERYRNSPVMHTSMPAEYKPMIFQNGVQIAFPEPTRTIKAPKVRANRDRQGSKEAA
eukprot:CAMPEP_0181529022 /NCGR_PEP_ID=MMETSP1110-20121109/70843_1 /TAXON_ID=174948 /ORGANISM="Symbiodinium sp., Strain CCMP421" /LENGTH=348 /DNA_ID=CAMNT_0023659993 /DNA_START=118 /DNA_END=1163 /DNA_ORIENTATION=-